ncbi:MAG: polysaccharide pyruvyl transferase family protein [Bacteroidales bacterium]|nr:polysaccharide pyruvyl transferase family protein [Bacteroidales bacterium]
MKIGILTYHRAENYGALVQAYALRTYLAGLGHDVDFVDYWPDYHRRFFELFSWRKFRESSLKGKMVLIYYTLFWHQARKRRQQNLQAFMHEELGLPLKARYRSDHDVVKEFEVVFYGSDQIWRRQRMPSHPGFDFWYFGSDTVQARKITYAASMGSSDVKEDEKEVLRQYLLGFEAISVREASLKEWLASLGIQAQIVCDPVFLLGKEAWLSLANKASEQLSYQHYILVYNLLGQTSTVNFAQRLSKEKNLPIVEVNKKYVLFTSGRRYCRTARVEYFLSLLAHADYVVSNSFHGVALSIIFQKQFFAVGMGPRAGRVTSLLNSLRIPERYTDVWRQVPPIDYTVVTPLLSDMVTSSRTFIRDSISNHLTSNEE